MGNPKQRWTLEEENALRAGVDKYGTGRWRTILADEEFASCLISRSNVDLKDKWRNLFNNSSSSVASPRCSIDKETSTWYNTTFLEALPSADNSYGLDLDTIHSYIKNVVDEAVQEVDIKEEEVDIVDEVVSQDYVQVLREAGYEEHEINVAIEHVEVVNELPIGGHAESAMSMNIEDSQDACLIDDTKTQSLILKTKSLLKLVFKALKKLMSVLKTSVQKMIWKIDVDVEDSEKLQNSCF